MPRARPVLQQTQDDREARTEQKEDSEASVPPIGFDEDGKLLLFGIEAVPEVWAIALVYFVQGILGISRLAVSFYYKDTLHLGPAELSLISSISVLPWVIKPLYGFISDSFPLFGYKRRSYLVLSGAVCVCVFVCGRCVRVWAGLLCVGGGGRRGGRQGQGGGGGGTWCACVCTCMRARAVVRWLTVPPLSRPRVFACTLACTPALSPPLPAPLPQACWARCRGRACRRCHLATCLPLVYIA